MKSEQFISHPHVFSGQFQRDAHLKNSTNVESWGYPVKIWGLISFSFSCK